MRAPIRLILNQGVLPELLIVIDVSDDHDSVRTEVYEISEPTLPRKYRRCKVKRGKLGSTGAILVFSLSRHPSRYSPMTTRCGTRLCKQRSEDLQGGCARPGRRLSGVGVLTPPPEFEQPTHKRSRFGSAKIALQPYRNYVEEHSFPKPFNVIGASTWTDKIDVVDDINSKRLPHVTGFRMSFRTDAVITPRVMKGLGCQSSKQWRANVP
jgi:hypothetical protein